MFCRTVLVTLTLPHSTRNCPTRPRYLNMYCGSHVVGKRITSIGRCQITYHLSYLNQGRTSIPAWRPLPLPPTTSHQSPDYGAQSPTQYLVWCTPRAISSSITLVVITNNNIYKWELFQHTYLTEKHKHFTNASASWVCLLQNTWERYLFKLPVFFFFCDTYPGVELLDHMVALFFCLFVSEEHPYCFP